MRYFASFGFIFGGAFSVLPMPLGLTLGLGVGIPSAVLALVDANKSIDKAWANRNSEPEQLLAVTMCLFGDAGVGAVSGLAGAAASKAIQRVDSDRLATNIIRFLKEEEGSQPINIDDWPFGNSQSKKIAQGFGKAAQSTESFAGEVQSALRSNLQKGEVAEYLMLDPNAKVGLTGSSATGTVGNPNKARYGKPIDPNDFDADLFIQSDLLYKKFGGKLVSTPKLRQALVESCPAIFQGLRPGKKGLSIKFRPESDPLPPGSVLF